MKEMIIILVIALFATAWVLDNGTPPQAVNAGVKDVETTKPAGTRKQDEIIGDFKIRDGYRPIKIRTTVYDDEDSRTEGNRNDSDFPLSGGTASI